MFDFLSGKSESIAMKHLPDAHYIAVETVKRIPDLSFALNHEEIMLPWIQKGVYAAIKLTQQACVQAASNYEPDGFEYWEDVKNNIVKAIESLDHMCPDKP